jgi:hypothetical protein
MKTKIKLFFLIPIMLLTISSVFTQTENSMPKVNMNYSIIKVIHGQDARDLSNNEVSIKLYINDEIIDEYTSFGSGEYWKEDMTFYLESDYSQKYYKISILNKSQILVSLNLFIDGEEQLVWNKTYSINSNNKWSKSKCDGNCN